VSDQSVALALRSSARIVLIESPAGCGKTHQGADYAAAIAPELGDGRLLILAHTHAACDVFSLRTANVSGRVEVRTIDSLVAEIAKIYKAGLGLDDEPMIWVRRRVDGFELLAKRVSDLLQHYPMIAQTLARRYHTLICDEHQDTNAHQQAIIMAIQRAGSKIAAFGDQMQRIHKSSARQRTADNNRWDELRRQAERVEKLDFPHRWANGSRELGAWVLEARERLEGGNPLNLRGKLPNGLRIIVAENTSPHHSGFKAVGPAAEEIRGIVQKSESLLILSHHKETVEFLRAQLGRQIPIWEGHTRSNLASLVANLTIASGNAAAVCDATIKFYQSVSAGFSNSSFGSRLRIEIANNCSGTCRGLPHELQSLARLIYGNPNHLGVAKFLMKLENLRKSHGAFKKISLDYTHEFWDAVRLGSNTDLEHGLGQLFASQSRKLHAPPRKAISTIHKSKGLEAKNVLLLPCNANTFGEKHRCLLYVALSRASHRLTLVVSRDKPSPLIEL
jgi:AAA domain/UvrD-like helicase C-terminal domain